MDKRGVRRFPNARVVSQPPLRDIQWNNAFSCHIEHTPLRDERFVSQISSFRAVYAYRTYLPNAIRPCLDAVWHALRRQDNEA